MYITIKWTTEAVIQYNKNIAYLQKDWSQKEVDKFKNSVNEVLGQLRKYPEIHPMSPIKAGVRRAKINKSISLFYKYVEDIAQIHVLTFWNVKRNLADIKL